MPKEYRGWPVRENKICAQRPAKGLLLKRRAGIRGGQLARFSVDS